MARSPCAGSCRAWGPHESVDWVPGTPDGVLAFTRPGFHCTVNTTGRPVRLPVPGRMVLASTEVTLSEGEFELPADSTVWWSV